MYSAYAFAYATSTSGVEAPAARCIARLPTAAATPHQAKAHRIVTIVCPIEFQDRAAAPPRTFARSAARSSADFRLSYTEVSTQLRPWSCSPGGSLDRVRTSDGSKTVVCSWPLADYP